jgi:hypothetical protein
MVPPIRHNAFVIYKMHVHCTSGPNSTGTRSESSCCSSPPEPERFFGRKKKSCTYLPLPHPQHLAGGLHELWSEEAWLISTCIDSGTVPISGVLIDEVYLKREWVGRDNFFLIPYTAIFKQWGNTSLWCRAENRTRARLTASRHATNWATPPILVVLFLSPPDLDYDTEQRMRH